MPIARAAKRIPGGRAYRAWPWRLAIVVGGCLAVIGAGIVFGRLPRQVRDDLVRSVHFGLWPARPVPMVLATNPMPLAFKRSEPATGPLRVHPDNPRYFMDATGQAILLSGSHTWANFQDMGHGNPPPEFDYPAYLDWLAANNHNFFRLWRWEQTRWSVQVQDADFWFGPQPYVRTGPGLALDGQPKFDLRQFNQVYFDRLRERVEAAAERGVYVSIMLFDGWSISRTKSGLAYHNPWHGHPFNAANNVNQIDGDLNDDDSGEEVHTLAEPEVTALQAAYVRKVIETVNDLDNVLFEISNESPMESAEWQAYWVDFVAAYEAGLPEQHPVGMTVAYPGDNGPLWNGAADWVSPNATGRRDMLGAYWGNLESPIVGDGAKVILYDTDHLCGICGDHKWLWKSFTRGLNPIFMDPYGYDEFGVGATDFRSANETQEGLRRNMGYLLAYADRLDLAKMEPRGDLCSTGYCLADPRPGGSYLVYLPQGGPVSVSLPVGSARLVAEWFDPVVGTVVTSGPIETEGSVSFEGPWKGEAVLFIHAAGEAGRGE